MKTIDAHSVAVLEYGGHIGTGDRVEISIGENAHLTYRVNDILSDLIHFIFYLNRNAVLELQLLLVNRDAHIILEVITCSEGAQANIRGMYLLSGHNNLRLETKQHHMAAHTKTDLVIKGIVTGSAQAHYCGTIRVEQIARESISLQENKNILLSDAACAVSIPNLEVLTNDVRCFHGSAVAQCDQEQLLYATSRGISKRKAQQLLLQAFVADVCKNDAMSMAIEQYMEYV